MTGRLGQQALLEVPPERRLIVPKGYGAHWGIDGSTRRVAIAWSRADGELGVESAEFAPFEGPHRLNDIYVATRQAVARRRTSGPLPGIVWLERGIANSRGANPDLIYALGVIQAAVWAGLGVATAYNARFELTQSTSWKKVACGRGDIYKPTRKALGRRPEFEDYGVAVWARDELGYEGSSWDEVDALGMVVAGRRTVMLEER